MTNTREVKESSMRQGVDERIAYTLTTTPWGSTPTSITVVAKDVSTTTTTDVTTTVFPTNSPSASGDIITLSLLRDLTVDHIYRIEIKFTCSGNIFETYCIIYAET
jgi:hypothetical protein